MSFFGEYVARLKDVAVAARGVQPWLQCTSAGNGEPLNCVQAERLLCPVCTLDNALVALDIEYAKVTNAGK